MNENADGRPIEIRLMNEYGGGIPLWESGEQTDGDELGLSDALRADLQAFSDRWQSSIPSEVTDDRWDDNRLMSRLVSARYALRRLLEPSARRAAATEDAEMRVLGQVLRDRIQQELGSDYNVVYRH